MYSVVMTAHYVTRVVGQGQVINRVSNFWLGHK